MVAKGSPVPVESNEILGWTRSAPTAEIAGIGPTVVGRTGMKK